MSLHDSVLPGLLPLYYWKRQMLGREGLGTRLAGTLTNSTDTVLPHFARYLIQCVQLTNTTTLETMLLQNMIVIPVVAIPQCSSSVEGAQVIIISSRLLSGRMAS